MCLRGASAIEDILKRNPADRLRVLVVWEPILPTDWVSPGRLVQSRISDARVTQFWDRHHLVAKEFSQQLSASSQPHCCRNDGILWDVAVLYLQPTQWNNASPDFVDGPVVKASRDLAKMLPGRGEQPHP